MNSLSDLPKISDAFLAHIKGRILRPGEWVPCPRCGSSNVDSPGGRNFLLSAFVGVGCMAGSGCIAIFIALVGWILLLETLAWPVAIVIFLVGLVIGGLLALSGRSYGCRSCGYRWDYRDVEDLRKTAP